ncbi:MAG TPA: SIMPL domain-containing protein [Dehalococcoidia bacterium]|nr:SIMPL domain-containing protein [Dehalococcoidia bacterium]
MNIMRTRIRYVLLGVALLAVAGLFAACGDDDDDGGNDDGVRQLQPGEIRTDKGSAVAALANSLGTNFGAAGNAESADDDTVADIDRAAAPGAAPSGISYGGDSVYGYWPQAASGGVGITVQGYGSATAAADSAVVEMYFYRDSYGDQPVPLPEPVPDAPNSDSGSGSSGSEGGADFRGQDLQPVEPITEADLQPVIDALNAAGATSVEFVEQGYFDRYYANATLRATFDGTGSIDGAVDAATNAANGLSGVFFSGSNAYYTVNDCSALEQAAMEAALEDANERGDVLAGVIGAARGEIIGASNYTYSPYGNGSCSSSGGYPIPLAEDGSVAPLGPTDVQVFSSLTITYAIN